MRILSVIIFFLLVGCSSHIERGSLTEEEYYNKITNKLDSKDVIVNCGSGESNEGEFIRIDKDFLIIKEAIEIKEIKTSDVKSIEYKRGSAFAGAIMGALAGFGAGIIIVELTDANINIGGGSKNPEMFLSIPLGILVGAIWGGIEIGGYKTIELEK
ncbi:MAG: hypothetical protein ABFS12_08595 [Bacteroidota bacterium]